VRLFYKNSNALRNCLQLRQETRDGRSGRSGGTDARLQHYGRNLLLQPKNLDEAARVLRPVTYSNVRGCLAFPQFLPRFLDTQREPCGQRNL
jgi:hypothetical protein